MSLKKKVSYKKIKKKTHNQFYKLVKELFPLLIVSTISKTGKITIQDKGIISFFRKANRVSIETFLFTYLPYALAIRYWGNEIDTNGNNIVNHYRRQAEDLIISKSIGNKVEDTSQIITLFYNECFNRDAKKEEVIHKIIVETPVNTDMDTWEDEESFEEKGTANFLDYVFNIPKRTKIHLKLKKYIIAASLLSLITAQAFLITLIQHKTVALNNFCLGIPPQNSSP